MRMIDTDKWIESARISLDELEKEVKRLREGIVNALIPTETRPIIHPLVKLGDLRNALKELIE